MQPIPGYIIVFVGAGIGGVLRHAVNRAAVTIGWTFPWHTLLVNVSGCLLMGMVAGWFAFRGESGQDFQLFLTTGVLGGYYYFFCLFVGCCIALGKRPGPECCALYWRFRCAVYRQRIPSAGIDS